MRTPETESIVESPPSVERLRAMPIGKELVRELRTDHAGEYGAVVIYEGILAVSRSRAVREFAADHLATERTHLAFMESLIPPEERSRLLPLWHAAAWLTGALPALLGQRAVMITIAAVETFVEGHYGRQIAMMSDEPALHGLRRVFEGFCADERAHKEDARSRLGTGGGWARRVWEWAVRAGSAAAVGTSRWI